MRKHLFTLALLAVGGFAFSQNYLKSSNIQLKNLDGNGNLTYISFTEKSLINSSETEALLKEALKFDEHNQLVAFSTKKDKNGGVHTFYKHYYKGLEVFGNGFVVHSKNGQITTINGAFNNVVLNNVPSNLKSGQQILNLGLAKLESGYVANASELPSDLKAQIPAHLHNAKIKGELTILPQSLTGSADKYAYSFPLLNVQTGAFDKNYMDALDGTILRKEEIVKLIQSKSSTVHSAFTQEQFDYLNQYVWNQHSNGFSFLNPEVTGTAETHYSGIKDIETKEVGGSYILEDETRFVRTRNFQGGEYLLLALTLAFGGTIEEAEASMTVDFVDNDNNWTNAEHAANKNDGALDAHWAFSQSYDYFKEEFDRDGYDNENSLVRSYVHVTFFGSPVNAAWLSLAPFGGEGGVMLVGDGDFNGTTGNYDILSTLDVMSHEFAHGVNAAGGGLIYEKEHGALDEGFADMWGATIEAAMAPEKDKWTIAEEVVQAEPKGFRSFRNPKLFNQPNTYNGDFYIETEGCTPGQDNDNCGVHTNSGVPNYWYYLISDGGTGTNDHGYEYTVTGFGIEKAAKLIYAVQENYVQSLSTFVDVMNFSITEAGVQYGENSAEVNTVKAAWCAVGVAEPESDVCTTLSVQDLNASQFSIYPNPVTDILNIKLSKSTQNLTYKITNLAGQLLQQGKVSNEKINLSILPKGTYVLTLKGDDLNQSVKFIKK
jgi:Zn-dependent metalloprotease